MTLNDHSCFKYAHGNRLLRQSKNKVFVFKMCMDLPSSGVDLMKFM